MTHIKNLKMSLLNDIVIGCRLCFKKKPKRVLFGAGNLNAKIVIVGQAPSPSAIGFSKPFGEKGLSRPVYLKILEALAVLEDEIWTTNVIKCTIPTYCIGSDKNCKRFLEREIRIIMPKFVICLGRVAVTTLSEGFQELDGQMWKGYIHPDITCFSLPHPMMVIRKNITLETYLGYVGKINEEIHRAQ